ncbi:MAG: phosphoheptose isomerase [Verrucomicrobia bacterium]|nr:MAG: phosphoheptose isomerase [Verrucomicrobiota bacterium]
MPSISETLAQAIRASTSTIQSVANLEQSLGRAAAMIEQCLHNGNKLLVCGNGGSAADAADFCTEFACRFVEDRRPFPAINLAQGGSLLTATANDYGFEEVFARQIRAFGNEDDLLIAISTSGKSKNIRRVLEEALSRKLKTIALLGRDGGSAVGLADVDLVVSGDSTARIQEAHKFILHVLCEAVEPQLRQK